MSNRRRQPHCRDFRMRPGRIAYSGVPPEGMNTTQRDERARRPDQLDRLFPVIYDARFESRGDSPDGSPRTPMARACEVCGKKTVFGHNVSHAHNVTNRKWRPNLQRVRIRIPQGGTRRVRICTRCLRSGAVQKAVS